MYLDLRSCDFVQPFAVLISFVFISLKTSFYEGEISVTFSSTFPWRRIKVKKHCGLCRWEQIWKQTTRFTVAFSSFLLTTFESGRNTAASACAQQSVSGASEARPASSVNKNNSNATLCSGCLAFLKPFSKNWGSASKAIVWRMYQLHPGPALFCSSFAKSEPTWMCPKELKLEATNTKTTKQGWREGIFSININTMTKRCLRKEIFACFLRF